MQDRDITRWLVSTSGIPTTIAAFTPDSTYERSATLPTAGGAVITTTLNSLRTSSIYTLNVGGEYDINRDTRLNAIASFSHAVSQNPHFTSLVAQVTGIAFQIDRRNRQEFEPLITQTAGPSWSDPASYRFTSLSNTITDGAPTDNYGFKADLKRQLNTTLPAYIKVGYKFSENVAKDLRRYESLTWLGPDGVPNSADDSIEKRAAYVFGIGAQNYGPFPFLPRLDSTEGVPGAQPNYWAKTAAQAYSDLTAGNARSAELDERMHAAYLLGNIKIGSLSALAGVRVERTDSDAYSWLRSASNAAGTSSLGGGSRDPVVVATNVDRALKSYVGKVHTTSKYDEVFPGAHLVWQPKEGLLIRGSYNRSIARPPISALLPNNSVNDDARTITIGNPDLKPFHSDNYEFSVEKYIDPVGLVSVGVFRKDITNYFRTFSEVLGSDGYDGSGAYAGYTLNTSRNIGSARINGIEVSAQQQFRSLPGIWSGLGAFANFTYLTTEGNFGTTVISKRLPNMTPKTANMGISYVGRGWQIRPMLNWLGRTYRGTSGVVDYDSLSRTWLDLKVQYNLSKRYSVEASVSNLLNEAESTLVSSNRRLPFVQIKPGTAFSLGLNGRL